MEQQIRFCTTADGVRIAYATVGQGPPLVYPPAWVSHLEVFWENPRVRTFIESLARCHTVVLYDRYGTGLSDRGRIDFSLEAEVRQAETVIGHLRLKRLALMGVSAGGPVAVAYAVKHPRRVSHLLLYGTYADGDAIAKDEFKASMVSLIRAHWGVGSKALADIFVPGGDAADIDWFVRFQRESATPDMAAELLALGYQIDVTDLATKLRVPTLVIHRQRDRAMPFRLGRELAALIPNARLVPLEGTVHLPWLDDADSVLRVVSEFLGVRGETAAEPERLAAEAVHTILFTDMEGSTTLTQRLGDAKAQDVLRTHNTILREALKAHSGSETKHTGDGIMASFSSATRALESAIAMQRAFAAHNESAAARPEPVEGRAEVIRVRIGLNAGEPVAEEKDLFGTAVQLAARICAHAEAGQILASNVVQELAAGKGFVFVDRGEATLKGFDKPVRLHEVRWQD